MVLEEGREGAAGRPAAQRSHINALLREGPAGCSWTPPAAGRCDGSHICCTSPPTPTSATRPGIDIKSVEFSTWFGGSDDTWAPSRDVYTMFKNMRLYRLDQPSGRTAGAAGLGSGGVQVVEYEEIQEGL